MQGLREDSFGRECVVVGTIRFQQKVGVPTYSLRGQEDHEFGAILDYITTRVCSKMKIKEFIKIICVYSTRSSMWHLIHFYIHTITLSEPKTEVQGSGNAHRLHAPEVLRPLPWDPLSPLQMILRLRCQCIVSHMHSALRVWESPLNSSLPPPLPSKTAQVFDDRPFDLDRPCSSLFLPCYRYKIGSQVWQDMPVITTLRKRIQWDFKAKPA